MFIPVVSVQFHSGEAKSVISCKIKKLEFEAEHHMVIAGTGRLAEHLSVAIQRSGFNVEQVYGRNLSKATILAEKIGAHAIDNLCDLNPETTLCILAISDDAIAELSEAIPVFKGLLVHTSGFRGLEEIHPKHIRRGVFYPLQTFTKGRATDFSEVPFFVEADKKEDAELLMHIASRMSKSVRISSFSERQFLHLAAVFVSNFSNSLYVTGKEILEQKGLDFSLLHPLILETAAKAVASDPFEGQTGPARRNDKGTIAKHLQMLHENPEVAAIYQLLTERILHQYHNNKNE